MPRLYTSLVALLFAIAGAPAGVAEASPGRAGTARFEGRLIDLSDGWGEARACAVDRVAVQCFRSEREMDRFLGAAGVAAACSSSLRLYDGPTYTGQVLSLATRGVWINLDAYYFAAKTSSYKIGACSSYFTDGRNGSGSWYPGNTAAGVQAPSMASGWDNRVRSVYIR